MDLNTIASFEAPATRDALPVFSPGDAWLAGGTWLFSAPQPALRRLIDLQAMGWPPIEATDAGLFVAATCTVAALEHFAPPVAWRAGPLIGQCCNAFLASFKIKGVATVGGNVCMALPAGPMISLGAALEATCVLWTPDGAERRVPVLDFVQGPQHTALRPGEVLRGLAFSDEAMRRQTAFRRLSLSAQGRSGVLVIGTRDAQGQIAINVTASTRRPHRIAPPLALDAAGVAALVDAEIARADYYDDIHGRPEWRRHMTLVYAAEVAAELAGAP